MTYGLDGIHAGIVSDQNRAKEVHTTHSLDGISCRHCQRSKSSTGGAHDSHPGWDFMQALSVIKNEHWRHMQLTRWMGFHAGIVSNQNRAQEAHTTYSLDGISCRHCQQSKSSSRGTHDSHPGWGFHAGIVSDHNRAQEAHMTHILDGISCRQYSDIVPLSIQTLPHIP